MILYNFTKDHNKQGLNMSAYKILKYNDNSAILEKKFGSFYE
jgi:hypothetical protein